MVVSNIISLPAVVARRWSQSRLQERPIRALQEKPESRSLILDQLGMPWLYVATSICPGGLMATPTRPTHIHCRASIREVMHKAVALHQPEHYGEPVRHI